jgi:hypothetical protein
MAISYFFSPLFGKKLGYKQSFDFYCEGTPFTK